MELVFGIIVGLIILVALVAVHELGHGIVARRNGVVVEEFGIGFPPKAWGKKIKKSVLGKNVLFTLNWLPLGGFVRLKGEHDAASEKGDYGAATYWVKTKILLAGVVMNWIVAIVLFTVLALWGMPKILPDQFSIASDTVATKDPLQVVNVIEDTPAAKAGLKQGDQVLRINDTKVDTSKSLSDETKSLAGQEVDIVYTSEGVEQSTKVQLNADNEAGKGFLGIQTREREELRSTWSAPIVGVGLTVQLTAATFSGIGTLLSDSITGFFQQFSSNEATKKVASEKLTSVSQQVTGPVGILGIIFPQAQKAGLKILVLISAIISLSLAVMNTLPIPALDGGRWATMTIYKLRKKTLTKEREEKIQTAGFIALLALIIMVTFADVGKF